MCNCSSKIYRGPIEGQLTLNAAWHLKNLLYWKLYLKHNQEEEDEEEEELFTPTLCSSSKDKTKAKKRRHGRDLTDGPLEENIKADCCSLTVRAENTDGLQALTAGHLRVVDNLEAIPFFERQVVSRPRFVVVQRHEERHATCRRAEGAFKTASCI